MIILKSLIILLLFLVNNYSFIQAAAQSTQKPDLLKFRLNIKPGIIDPSSSNTHKNDKLLPLATKFHSEAQALVYSKGQGNKNQINKNASSSSSGGTITIKDKYISKWSHSKTGIASGDNLGINTITEAKLKTEAKINKENNFGTNSGAAGSSQIKSEANKPTTTTSQANTAQASNPSKASENYANEIPAISNNASPIGTSSTVPPVQYLNNNIGIAAQTASTTTTNNYVAASELPASISSIYSTSSNLPSTPYVPSTLQNIPYTSQKTSATNFNQPDYAASPPAISPYQSKSEAKLEQGNNAVPSRDEYEASVLEQTEGGIVTTSSIATTSTSTAATSISTTIPTTISTTTRVPPCGPDVLFVLDSTGSVRNVYEAQRSYILDVIKQMDIAPDGQHVGLIIYSSKLRQRIVVNLDELKTKEEFLKIVHELPYHGGITATGAALSLTSKALEKRRSNKRTLVILLTDGYTYDNWEEPSRLLHTKSVEILVAGDVKNYLRPVLDKIAGDPAKVLLGDENKSKVLDYLRCR